MPGIFEVHEDQDIGRGVHHLGGGDPDDEEETLFEHSQKQHLYYLPQEKESPVKHKKHKKKENGFPKLRADGRQVLQQLPYSLGGKQFLPSQTANNTNAMAPKTHGTKGKSGKAKKKDRAALEKQILELKEQLKKHKKDEDEDDSDKDYASDDTVDVPPAKKVKGEKFQPFAVPYDASEAIKIKNSMRRWVIPHVKFLANEEEAKQCMKIAITMTNHWEEKGLDQLSEEELDLQMEEYMRTYGTECVRKFVNGQRNQMGQALRKVFMALYKDGKTFTPNQLLSVITRNPDLLLLKPTKFRTSTAKTQKAAAENLVVNQQNKKHRNRFYIYVDQLIPAVTPQGIWNVEQRRLHMLHCCQHLVAGELKDVVPVDEEAMIFLMWENNHDKWAWQAMVQKDKSMNVEQYKKHVGLEEFMKQQPEALYSDALSGNSKYGGWSEKGVLRFAEVRDLIEMARKDGKCRKVEMQFQKLLESKYPEPKKKKARSKKVVPQQTRTSVAFGGGGAAKKKKGNGKASLHVCYDSEEENKKVEAVLNFDKKNEGKKKKGKGKNQEALAEKKQDDNDGHESDEDGGATGDDDAAVVQEPDDDQEEEDAAGTGGGGDE